MTKKYLFTLVAVMAMALGVQAQTIVLDETFESGELTQWTQEYVVGQTAWAVEDVADGLNYPATAFQGTKRAYLRNTTNETQGYVTRLISPVMKLDTVYQPMLVFWYANPKWTTDRDTLRVLYKVGPKASWKQLAEYSDASANWTKVAITLPEYSEAYQIAFEGKDNLGRGIVLDSIKVRSTPECTVPHDMSISSLGNGKATLSWQASWDATEFDLIIATEAIDPDTVQNVGDSLIVYNKKVDGLLHSYDVTLTSGKYFYAYVRSICEAEISEWCTYYFRMKATKYAPFFENFNMDYNAGYLSRNLEWTYGGNTGNYNPFISTHLNETENSVYTTDGTTNLQFTGANNSTTAIPAGKYVYAASPGLADSTVANFQMKDYQVRFWSTVATYTGKYAHSIIVGVMTDPEDVTTFVAVDTVSVWGCSTFQENIVSFENYTGDGLYIAFASNFDKQNLFYIDNMTFERRPAVNKVTKVKVNPRDTYAEITWEGNASSYNVIVATSDVEASKLKTTDIVETATVTTNSYTASTLEAGHGWDKPYYVYVQAMDGTKELEWSYRVPFVTITKATLPMNFDMEQASGCYYLNGIATTMYPSNIGIFTNDPEYPHLYTTNPRGGLSCLYLTKDPGNDSWITFPLVEGQELKKTQITFYLSGNTTPGQTHATVGVMTNPMDISTFEPVADFTLASQGYYRCYANFKNYTGKGEVIAIVWTDVAGNKNTINYIDDVVIEEAGVCVPPVGVNSVINAYDATFSWDAGDLTQWQVVLTNTQVGADEIDLTSSAIAKKIIRVDTVTVDAGTPQVKYDKLSYGTPYFLYIRALCDESASWWSETPFTTVYPDKFEVPYTEGFERTSGVDLGAWGAYDSGTGTGYPKIMTTAALNTKQSCELWSTSTTHRTWIVAPQVNCPMEDLLITFYARSYSTSSKSVVYVGTMEDPENPATFHGLDTFYMDGSTAFNKFGVDMANYNGTDKYIAFTSGLAETLELSSDIYLDEITFQNVVCAAPYSFEAVDATQTSLTMTWKGKSTDKWEYMVLDKYVAPKDSLLKLVNAKQVIAKGETANDVKTFKVENLKTLTKYYIYIRPTCGDMEWAVDSAKTECFTINPNVLNKETFEQYTSAGTSYSAAAIPDCWLGGNNGPSTSTTYLPFIYKSTTYSQSGNNSLRLYGYNTTTATSCANPAWVATPKIDTDDMSKIVVNFYAYASTSYYCVYGVMTDPEDFSTFVTLDSVKGLGKSVLISVDLGDYKSQLGNAKYFAWRTRIGATDYIYLDDISIVSATCPMAKPAVSELTSTSARISSGIRTDNDWRLVLSDKEISTDSLTVRGLGKTDTVFQISAKEKARILYNETISGRSKTLTILEEQTDYYVYVQCDCDSVYGAWAMLHFKTPCNAKTPEEFGVINFSTAEGYATGSGKELPCWTVGNKNSTTATYIPYINNAAAYKYNDNNYLYMYNYVSSTANNSGGYAITPMLNVDDISKYQVNFYGRAYNATTATTLAYGKELIVGVVTDPSDLNTFVPIDTLVGSNTAYEAFTVNFENYDGDYLGNKGKYIMFMVEVPSTSSYTYFYITGVSVTKIPSCRPPYDAVADSIAEDAARITWKGYTEQTRVTLSKTVVADNAKAAYTDWTLDTIVTGNSIELAKLSVGTDYYVCLQPICSESEEADFMLGSVSFQTECPVTKGYDMPYYNDFDKSTKTGSGNRPHCWLGFEWNPLADTLYTTQTYPYVYTTTSYSYDKKGYSMYMYSYRTASTSTSPSQYITYAVAPLVAGDLNEQMVSFYARKSSSTATTYGKTIRVGYVTDCSSEKAIVKSFVKLADVDCEQSTVNYVYCQVNMADLKMKIPAGARIALIANPDYSTHLTVTSANYAGFYIDNFKIGLPPSCYAPTLEAGNTTLYSAEVKIHPAKEENTQWELSVMRNDVYERNNETISKVIENPDSTMLLTVNDTLVNVENLEPGTTYQIFARTICGGEDGTSEWSDASLSLHTQYYYADSYKFGFEKSEGWVRSAYSTSDSYYLHPALIEGYEGGTASTSYSYYPYGYESTSSYRYSYGNGGTEGVGALRLYGTTSYYGGYVIFPGVVDAKARSFSFQARAGYAYDPSYSTYKGKMSSVYAGAVMSIGLIDKNKGFDTFEEIAQITLPTLTTSDTARADNNWLFSNYTFDLDSATMANKQVVLYQSKPSITQYIYIDNVELGEPKGYGYVSLGKIECSADKATVNWANIGGPWNLYVYTTTTVGKTKKNDTVAVYTNLKTLSQEVTGLKAQTTYNVSLVCANAPANTIDMIRSTKSFTTPCYPIEANEYGEFFWDFNDPSDWERSDVLPGTAADTAYYKPGCFTVGTTYTTPASYPYYNWLIQRTGYTYTSAPTSYSTSYNHYEVGRDESSSLRIYSGGASYMTPYIVLPELNCSFDTMMIEFWGRCFINYDATYSTAASRNKMVSATYLGTSYSKSIVVGTLTDPKDFSTLEVVDTVTYSAYASTTAALVTADPTGQRYWQKFQLPLSSAKGKYIVLFQPKYGLFFLDDLSIKPVGDNIFAPGGLQVKEVDATSVTLAWNPKHPTLQTVVTIKDHDGKLVTTQTVTGNTVTITDLEPGTEYTWSIYQTNGSANSSEVGGTGFVTDCLEVPTNYSCGFELEDGWRLIPGQSSLTYKQTSCWVYGNAGTSTSWSSSYCAYNYPATSTISYAHSGAYAIHLEAYSTTYQPYVAMPATDVNAFDTLQVNFWMRAGYHNPTKGKISTQYTTGSTEATADYYYSRSVIVGTMTDPNDATTFVPIDTLTYSRKLTTNDDANAANDFLFEKQSVSLEGATGPYVAFMATLLAKGDSLDRKATYGHIYLDDISFSRKQECMTPGNLGVKDVESDGATLTWDAGEISTAYIVQVAVDEDFTDESDLIVNDTVETNSYTITGLDSYTNYVWRVASICGRQGTSDFSAKSVFNTLREPFFLEDFRDANLDAEWQFATNPAVKVFDSTSVVFSGSNSTTYGFKRVTGTAMTGYHYCVPFYSSSSTTSYVNDYYWMLSPVIALDADDKALFSMDMALSLASSGYSPTTGAISDKNVADDFIFLIAISDDGGATWKKENAQGWAGQDILNIGTGSNVRIDLSKYAGKKIRIGFYREAQTYKSQGLALHFTNVRVNYFDQFAIDTTLCQYNDMEAYDGYFQIDGDNIEAGEHFYSALDKASEIEATESAARDTLYEMTANYIQVPEVVVADTICEGESYTGYDFMGKTTTGLYRKKLQSYEYCDSIVTLHLSVTPRAYAETENQVICQGESYTWNGVAYNRAGVYRDTLVSSLGCDSIETLSLTFFAVEDTIYRTSTVDEDKLPFTYTDNEYPYMMGVEPIAYPAGTTAGTYVDTVAVQGVNCTAVLIHTLIINPVAGVEDVDAEQVRDGAYKIIVNDHLYIVRDDEWFDATGKKVKSVKK